MNKKFAIVLALSLIAIVCCAGCIDPQDPVDPVDPVVPVDPVDPVTPPVEPVVPAEEYSVFFMLNYDGAGAYSAETVTAGDAVSKPATPTRSGYTFKGWFTAAEGGAEYDFTQAVNADLTLYAQWSKKSSSGGSSHSHSYTATVTEPTCTTDGYTTYTCSCGHSYTGNTVPMLGHELELVTENGVTYKNCTRCDYSETVPAGVTYVAQIGNNFYEKFAWAMENASTGQTIKLLGAVTDGAVDKAVAINGNDQTASLAYTNVDYIKILKANWTETNTVTLSGKIVAFETNANAEGYLVVKSAKDASGNLDIYTAEGLRDFAECIPTDARSFNNKEVNLMDDISLADEPWTPINAYDGIGSGITVTLNGNGNAIYDMSVNGVGKVGFIGPNIISWNIKDLTFENANVVTSGSFAGVVIGWQYGDVTMENVDVIDSTVSTTNDKGIRLGGLVGYSVQCQGDNAILTLTGCTIDGLTVTGYHNVGGFVGSTVRWLGDDTSVSDGSRFTVNNCEIKNSQIIYTATGGIGGHYLAAGTSGYKDAAWTGNGITVENVQIIGPDLKQSEDENGNDVFTVSSAAGLKYVMDNNLFGSAGSGDQTLIFDKDAEIDMSGHAWTPISVDGYNGADIMTIEGNGATITGLTAPLFAGGFAGGSGIIIYDLTIADSDIVSSDDIGSGAFIEHIDSMNTITLINCHLTCSTVTGDGRTGGLIGWTAGYNNVNDGPVKTYVTIQDCSVTDCEITAPNSVGGLYGHAGNNAWTYSTIENCIVKDNILTSTSTGDWRVGVVVGTANVGEVTISGITESGNTLTQTGKTAPAGQSNLYGRFVPGTTGKLVIDGNGILNGGITYTEGEDGSKTYTTSETITLDVLASLTASMDSEDTVVLGGNVEETTTATGYGCADIVLNGGTFDGNGNTLSVDGSGDYSAIVTTGGTIQNLIIDNGFRGIFLQDMTADVYIDNAHLGGDGVCYCINTGTNTGDYSLIVTNSELSGWTSFAQIKSASFTKCKFGQGTYYNDIYGRVLKPYVNTELIKCSFIEHMNLDLTELVDGHKITIKDCTVNGQAVTADVFTVPTTDAEYDTELFTVDLPSWATSINDCIVFE